MTNIQNTAENIKNTEITIVETYSGHLAESSYVKRTLIQDSKDKGKPTKAIKEFSQKSKGPLN